MIPAVLETVWPGEIVIYDPRAGEIRGHKQLRQFIGQNKSWLAGLRAGPRPFASTSQAGARWSNCWPTWPTMAGK